MPWLHAVIEVPRARIGETADYWAAATGWRVGPPWPEHQELRSFAPRDGTPYFHLQEIEGAPRVHLDLESGDTDETVRRALALGAQPVAGQDSWRTLLSPGGLPFGVLGTREHQAPGPVTWPDGHRTRLVQVCVDSPRTAHHREVAFWRELLAGRWLASDSPEFEGKWHDDEGSPLQLLFQRLDEEDGAVRAHLDLGTDDIAADARRLLDLGACDIGPGRGWHALRDPAGLAFCTTGNSPEQVRHRDL
jgi:hypothetical protein